MNYKEKKIIQHSINVYNWKPVSLSELTAIIFSMELKYLGSEAYN